MSKHQPYKDINKFLITERALNYILRPVQVRKENYPHTYISENLEEEISVTVDRAWTFANHMVLDFIGHELFEKEYKKVVEKRNTWRNEFSESLLHNAYKLIEYSAHQIPGELKQYYEKFVEYKKCLDVTDRLWKLLNQNESANINKDLAEYENKYQNAENRKKEIREELGIGLMNQLESIYVQINKSIKPFYVEFKMSKLIERYDFFFKKRRKEYLLNLIKRTSDVRFTFEYPLRVPVTRENISQQKTTIKIVTTQLEKVQVTNDSIFNWS